MPEVLLAAGHEPAAPIHPVRAGGWEAAAEAVSPQARAAAAMARFSGQAGEVVCIPGEAGAVLEAFVGLGEGPPRAAPWRGAAARLPAGDYRIVGDPGADPARAALAFAQGAYGFDRYRAGPARAPARLAVGEGVDLMGVRRLADACALARDMVNTPANHMGPAEIEAVARDMAARHGATIAVVAGDALLEAGYPAVHAVGRAAHPARAPRMIEIAWGDPAAPPLAVIGKGVVFDTGGLDIKPSAGMRLMKKDMGGAAHALALAALIMGAGLAVRLHALIPVAENVIAADAMRPGDVIASRRGLSIEIGNTDAEGRLILADALARAGELAPALTLDLATLTGAARVALGPQVIPFFTDDEALAAELIRASAAAEDPLWRLPLWRGYAGGLDSDIADLKNDPDAWVQAGAIAAALFLQRFAPPGPWAHFDIYAWNPKARPGWPVGAEAQAILAIFEMLERRFAKP